MENTERDQKEWRRRIRPEDYVFFDQEVNNHSFDLEKYHNAIQEKIDILHDFEGKTTFNQKLQQKILKLENEKEKLETQIIADKKINELEKSNIELKIKLENNTENLLNTKQEKLILAEKADSKEKISFVMMKKYYMTIAITGLMIGGFIGAYTLYQDSIDDDYMMLVGEHAKSKYLVQNLRGDTLKTWFPWMLAGTQALHVNILDNNLATEERIDVIQNIISSEETLDIDNLLTHKGPKGTTSTYYKGWSGALQIAAQQNTELVIPQSFEFSNSKRPLGDITVELVISQ